MSSSDGEDGRDDKQRHHDESWHFKLEPERSPKSSPPCFLSCHVIRWTSGCFDGLLTHAGARTHGLTLPPPSPASSTSFGIPGASGGRDWEAEKRVSAAGEVDWTRSIEFEAREGAVLVMYAWYDGSPLGGVEHCREGF